MKASDYIDFLVAGECSKLAIADVGDMTANPSPTPSAVQTVNQNKFISYLNLANLALHKRFYLRQKTFEIDYPQADEEYTLPSDFLIPIHAYYEDMCPVSIRDDSFKVINSIDTSVSLLLPEPFKIVVKGTDQSNPVRTLITLKYAAAPAKITKTYHDLNISEVYTEGLLFYAAYRAYSAISGLMKDENNTYYLRYEAACKQIVNSGMWGNNEVSENTKLIDNGFV